MDGIQRAAASVRLGREDRAADRLARGLDDECAIHWRINRYCGTNGLAQTKAMVLRGNERGAISSYRACAHHAVLLELANVTQQ